MKFFSTKVLTWSFFAITIGLHAIFLWDELLAEKLYGKSIFPIVRSILDNTLGLIPFALYHISWLVFIAFLFRSLIPLFERKAKILDRLLTFIKRLFVLIVALYCIFYWLWGYNYYRPSFNQRIDLSADLPDLDWIEKEAIKQITQLNKLRNHEDLSFLNDSTSSTQLPQVFERRNEILNEVVSKLPDFGYNLQARPVIRSLRPEGVFLHWSTTGMYWPFTGEANIDHGIHLIKKPVTMAHEYTHSFGVTDEGDCNLLGYLACRDSDDVFFQYSAAYTYFRYLMNVYQKYAERESVKQLYDLLTDDVIKDLESIREKHAAFTAWMPRLRSRAYDAYLKTNQVKEGIASYNRFIIMLYNLEKSEFSE